MAQDQERSSAIREAFGRPTKVGCEQSRSNTPKGGRIPEEEPRKSASLHAALDETWYRANLHEARKQRKAYRLSNREKWRAYDRKVYREKLKTNAKWRARKKERNRLWVKRNPEKQRHRVGRYRVRRVGAKGSHTFAEWLSVIRLYRWRCFYCQKRVTRSTVTKDHLIPLSKNGTDFAANLVPACKSCNSWKSGRLAYKSWKGG
jgi:5-methylcytosine-specific restriction endonuclease McrA